jgi:metal-responsive CopG/Arc/MetJ family transcriptional regulator
MVAPRTSAAKRKVTFTLPVEMDHILDATKERTGIDRSRLVLDALRAYKPVRETLASADAAA